MVRILVVDDDLDFQQLMQDVCAEQGWCALGSTSPTAAYAAMALTVPDLVLVDLRIQERQAGWDILTYLQLHPRLCRVPAILCSAMRDQVEGKRDWLAAHRIPVLHKPFDLEEMYTLIDHALSQVAPALPAAV